MMVPAKEFPSLSLLVPDLVGMVQRASGAHD